MHDLPEKRQGIAFSFKHLTILIQSGADALAYRGVDAAVVADDLDAQLGILDSVRLRFLSFQVRQNPAARNSGQLTRERTHDC